MKRRIRLLLAVLLVAICAAAQTDNPVADPKAIVVSGQARFTVLTPQLIRMEWSESGKFEDHASLVFVNRRLPVPKFSANTFVSGRNAYLVELGGLKQWEAAASAAPNWR